MTIILSGAAVSLQAGTAVSSVASLIGMGSGVGITYVGNLIGAGAFSTAPGAAAGSASAAAILGAGATSTALGAVVGGVTGALSSGAANLCQVMAAGPLGHLLMGTDPKDYSFDCWKALLHDDSVEPSQGKSFKEVVMDARVEEARFEGCELILKNVWGEDYRVDVVELPNQVTLHAVKIN